MIKAHNIMCIDADAPFDGATNVLCAINEQISDIMEIVMQEHKFHNELYGNSKYLQKVNYPI